MPPRFSYWTIIAGGLPTAFRATEREELLPTFTRLKEKHPDAEMKWFARGKLWASPEAASEDNRARARGTDRGTDAGGKGRHRDRVEGGGERREARGRDWRPGGEHRDPRQKYKDQKKERNQHIKQEKFLRKFTAQHDRRNGPDGEQEPRERREAPRPREEQRPWTTPREEKRAWSKPGEEKRPQSKPREEKRPWSKPRTGERAAAPRPRREEGGWTPPHGDKLAPRASKPWAPKPRTGEGGKPFGAKPAGRGWSGDRAKGPYGQTDRFRKDDRRPWPSSRRDEERPHGDPLAPEHRSGARGSRQGSQRPWTPKPRSGEERPWQQKPRTGEGRPFTPRPRGAEERPLPPKPRGGEERPLPPKPRGGEERPLPPKPRGGEERPWAPKPRSGEGGFRGRGHGDNAWKPKGGPDNARPATPRNGEGRPFQPRGFERDRARGSGTEEPQSPPRPRGPNREPRPGEEPPPSKPPRPSEPVVPPPGPPERGRLNRNKRSR